MSVQSSKKQKERSCTGHQHEPSKWGVQILSSTHGSAVRTVQERKRFSTGLSTDRVHHLAQHGSPARGMSVRRATSIFRTRGVLLNTDRAERVLHRSRLALHGACFSGSHGACKSAPVTRYARVTFASAWVKLGSERGVQFSFFWGRNPKFFTVFRVCYDLRILIGLNWESC